MRYLLTAILLVALSTQAYPKRVYVTIDGEKWERIMARPYLDLDTGSLKVEDVSKWGMVYPKKEKRCPKGYVYFEMNSTTFIYQQCEKR